jgi:hypothetical protein
MDYYSLPKQNGIISHYRMNEESDKAKERPAAAMDN